MWRGMATSANLSKMKEVSSVLWSEGFFSSSMLLVVCGCLSLLWATSKWVHGGRKTEKARFPPGPPGLPIIGHMHLLRNLPHQVLAKLSSQYGDMMGLKLGQQKMVVVSTPELAKQFLVAHDKIFANRPPYAFPDYLVYGRENDLFFDLGGERLRNRRMVCTLQLFSAKRLHELEYVRREELGALLHKIALLSRGGTTPIDIGSCVGEMSTNVMSRLVYSWDRASELDKRVRDLPQLVKEMEQVAFPFVGDFISWLSWFDIFTKQRMRRFQRRMDAVATNIVAERKQAMIMQDNSPKDDLLHALLTREGEGSLTMDEVKSIVMGVFGGSIHTTALTLEWAMAELLKNPHCVAKLQREMDEVIGEKRQIGDADIPKLRYLRCVVKEVFRLHTAGPLLLPRFSTQECRVESYTIPARTQLLVNVWAIARDERVWQNATQFMPERFEGKEEIDVRGQHFELLPFGTGRRICLGMPLAINVVEVTIANLVHRFHWELPPGVTCDSINLNEKPGLAANKEAPTFAIPKLRV